MPDVLILGGCARCASNQLARERLARLEEVLLNTRRELLSTRRELNATRRQLEKQQQLTELQEQHPLSQPVSTAAWPSAIAMEPQQSPDSDEIAGSSAQLDDGSEPGRGKLLSASLPIPSSRPDSHRPVAAEGVGPPGAAAKRSAQTPRRLRFESSGAPSKGSREATHALAPGAPPAVAPETKPAVAPSICTGATLNSASVKAKAAAAVPSSRRGAGLGSASALDRSSITPVVPIHALGSGTGRGGASRGSGSVAVVASHRRSAREGKPSAGAVLPPAQPARRVPLQPMGLQTMQKERWAASALTELKMAKLRRARAGAAATTLQAAVRGNAARGIATRRWLEAQCGPLTASLD
jgi:hypothetical protein